MVAKKDKAVKKEEGAADEKAEGADGKKEKDAGVKKDDGEDPMDEDWKSFPLFGAGGAGDADGAVVKKED